MTGVFAVKCSPRVTFSAGGLRLRVFEQGQGCAWRGDEQLQDAKDRIYRLSATRLGAALGETWHGIIDY